MRPFLPTSQLRRFQFESEILGRLQHPGIAHIYEAGIETVQFSSGVSTRQPFLAMELVEGVSVAAHARTLDLQGRLALVAEICEAVQYAHRRGVIHRDLKPANILVESSGRPKILDFGVARVVDASSPMGAGTLYTRAGEIVGTLPYMSPEQLRGDREAIDTQSDVYALGVLLYEFLTGRHPYPFPNGDVSEISDRLHATSFLAPSEWDRACRGDIDTIVSKAIADDKGRRYDSAAALAADIGRHLRSEPIEARADSGWYVLRKQVRRHRLSVTVGMLFLAALVAFAVVSWTLFISAERARETADREREEATERLWESYLASARLGRSSRLPGRRFDSLDAIAKASAIRPSPELRDEAIASMALMDLRPVQEVEGVPGGTAAGQAELDRLVWIENDSISVVMDIVSGKRLATLKGPGARVWVHRFSPDGRFMAARYGLSPRQAIWVWDVTNERPVIKIPEGRFIGSGMTFHPRSEWVAFTEADSSVRIYELPGGSPWGTIPDVGAATLLAVHPDGERLATVSDGKVSVWSARSGQLLSTTETPSFAHAIDYTPDGRWLAAAAGDGRIYLWDASSGVLDRTLDSHAAPATGVFFGTQDLLASRGWDGTSRIWDLRRDLPVFDPIQDLIVAGMAGNRILFQTHRGHCLLMQIESVPELARISCDHEFRGPGQITIGGGGALLATASGNGLYVWSLSTRERVGWLSGGRNSDVLFIPDALLSCTDRNLLRWPLHQEGTHQRVGDPVDIAPAHDPGFLDLHPDGRSVVVVGPHDRTRNYLARIHLESGEVTDSVTVPRGAEHPKVSADGRWVFLGNWRGPGGHVVDALTGEVQRQFPGSSVVGEFSPDGRSLLVTDRHSYHFVDVATWEDRMIVPCPERAHTGKIAFHPDGQMVAVTYSRYMIWLLDVETGAVLCRLQNPDLKPITALAFAPSGDPLVALATGQEVLLWYITGIRTRLRGLGLDWGS
jgi:WD40 repeat protein